LDVRDERLNLQPGLGLEVNGAANTAAARRKDERPTHDQLYLASRLSLEAAPQGKLTPAAIQKLNTRYGVAVVENAMRLLRGFPPDPPVRSSYAYLVAICEKSL
jgi:hypothetical protein